MLSQAPFAFFLWITLLSLIIFCVIIVRDFASEVFGDDEYYDNVKATFWVAGVAAYIDVDYFVLLCFVWASLRVLGAFFKRGYL